MKIIFICVLVVVLGLGLASVVSATSCSTRPASGNHTINDACSFPSTIDGVDSGTGDTNTAVLTVTTGGTLTVGAGTTLAVGSLSLTGGSIVVVNTGLVKIGTPLYVVDADTDNYSPSPSTFYTSSGTGRVRRNTLANLSNTDCDDGDSERHPNASCRCGNKDYDCSGAITKCLNYYTCTTCTGGYKNVVVPGIQSPTDCGAQGWWWYDVFPGQTCVPGTLCPARTDGKVCMTCK
jgi:hypothetical protein